jgi:pimeloyl-ACP methyl ester carboxylesterase
LPAIRKLRCTVSEIHGTEDALAPFGNQAFIRKNLPLSQRYFLTYKHADHFIIWKHPNAVQQLL